MLWSACWLLRGMAWLTVATSRINDASERTHQDNATSGINGASTSSPSRPKLDRTDRFGAVECRREAQLM